MSGQVGYFVETMVWLGVELGSLMIDRIRSKKRNLAQVECVSDDSPYRRLDPLVIPVGARRRLFQSRETCPFYFKWGCHHRLQQS